jgi:hypothetical protein
VRETQLCIATGERLDKKALSPAGIWRQLGIGLHDTRVISGIGHSIAPLQLRYDPVARTVLVLAGWGQTQADVRSTAATK